MFHVFKKKENGDLQLIHTFKTKESALAFLKMNEYYGHNLVIIDGEYLCSQYQF